MFYGETNVARRDWVPFPWSHSQLESEPGLEARFFHAWLHQICPQRLMVSFGPYKLENL